MNGHEIAGWAWNLGLLGKGFILLALAGHLVAAVLSFVAKGDAKKNALSQRMMLLGGLSFFAALACLGSLFLGHQFGFEYVRKHSALDHELQYLVAGMWAGQEGSFLLWALTSSLFAMIVAPKTGIYRPWFTFVASLFLAALAGILTYETPFSIAAAGTDLSDGVGLNASLLNYWMVIHPPVIFLGFGSLTAMFAWACSALLTRNLNDWVPGLRPFAIVSATLLGLGLCMGGFWAYETLGWGGFWMWDPVENTSFVPWVVVAALIHGIILQVTRGSWKLGNVVLAALPFLLFGYGTFLTRSGFLGDTSVHSFAEMDRSALWILIGTVLASILGFVWLLFTRGREMARSGVIVSPAKVAGFWHKERMYTFGIWLLLATGVVTGIGMSVPLLQSLAGKSPKVVEEHLYHQVLSWPYPVIVVLVGLTPFLSWKQKPIKEILGSLINVLAMTFFVVGCLTLWVKWAGKELVIGNFAILIPGQPAVIDKKIHFFGGVEVGALPWILFLTGLTVFAILANLARMWGNRKRNLSGLGGFIVHIGVMVSMAGLVFSRGFEQRVDFLAHPTKTADAFGYAVDVEGPTEKYPFIGRTSEYTDRKNRIRLVVHDQNEKFVATPGLYFMPMASGPAPMVWPYVHRTPLYDLYFVAHEFTFQGSEPTPFQPGEQARFNTILVQFDGLRTEGELGTVGVKFIADITITDENGPRKYSPYFQFMGQGEAERPSIPVSDAYSVYLDHVDAATKEPYLVIDYRTEAYPVEVYYKPLTGFVWWGVGIMTLGGLMAGYARRGPKKSPSSNLEDRPEIEQSEESQDATPEPVEV